MVRPNQPKPRRRVWRITESAPMGEFVDPDQAGVSAPVPLEPEEPERRGGWLESSLDLLNGSEVVDNPDTSPDDLYDEFWGSPDKNDLVDKDDHPAPQAAPDDADKTSAPGPVPAKKR